MQGGLAISYEFRGSFDSLENVREDDGCTMPRHVGGRQAHSSGAIKQTEPSSHVQGTMTSSNPSSANPSRTSTPNPATASRFTAQASTAEDLLKSQTVGLVHLSDFRKRRAEALEQKEREAQDRSLGRFSGSATPASDG
jgi:hypothetical protein